MAGLTIFLASRASDFVTGQTVATDGGFPIAMALAAGVVVGVVVLLAAASMYEWDEWNWPQPPWAATP